LENLTSNAQLRGQSLADEFPSEWPTLKGIELKDLVWFFEVVDIRMTAAPVAASWLAYGTLIARSETPGSIQSAETAERGGWPER
jgi:hypothetical protein